VAIELSEHRELMDSDSTLTNLHLTRPEDLFG
jgi:hypothetical protein